MAIRFPEKYRKHFPPGSPFTSKPGDGGVFLIPLPNAVTAQVVASNGQGWEHVSVVCYEGKTEVTPAWEEMAQIKNIFWEEEDCVIQYHPPMSKYVNNHEHCLHLWRPTDQNIPQPDPRMVGILKKQNLNT